MTELADERLGELIAIPFAAGSAEVNAMARELLSLRQSHSTGVAVNAALVERFQSAYRAAGQKRNWHPTWPDAEASFEILSALYTHPKEAEVTVTEEDVELGMNAFIEEVRRQDGEWTDDFDEERLLTSPSGDWFAPFFPIRAALVAALSRKG